MFLITSNPNLDTETIIMIHCTGLQTALTFSAECTNAVLLLLESKSKLTLRVSCLLSPLRNIARVVSQVHAFQERLYSYPPDLELQSYLRGRIVRFGRCDIPLLASDNHINFSQTPAAHRIHDTLRRVKASFQWPAQMCNELELWWLRELSTLQFKKTPAN